MSDTAPPPDLRAPIRMWRDARAFLVNLWSILGDPEDLASAGAVTRKLHKLYCSWLRVAEAVMRHLLMIEAAALGVPAPTRAHASRSQRVRRQMEFFPDKPEDWRVSFRCRISPARGGDVAVGDGGGASRSPSPRVLSTWPLAERYEAILRVFNDPIPYARRLARRLHARPELARALTRRPPEYVHRIDRADDITEAAAQAWPPDSS